MRRTIAMRLAIAAFCCCAMLVPTSAQSKPAVATTAAQTIAAAPNNLEQVLTQLDAAAARFKSAQADFQWDQYQKVVNETDVQKGRVYFQKRDHETLMAADITE